VVIAIGLLCLVGSVRSCWVQERPYARQEAAWRRSADEGRDTFAKIQSLGGIAHYYVGKYTRGHGLYVDLSAWHGSRTDLACLANPPEVNELDR
jgi:hypothetical protein